MGSRSAATVVPIWLLYCFLAVGQQTGSPANADCIDCHTKLNPAVVSEWKQSKHSQNNVDCVACHSADHRSADDVANVRIARPDVCLQCHKTQFDQDRQGKHAKALAAMKTMPNLHWRPMTEAGGQQGCVQCHRIGSPRTTQSKERGKIGGIESGGQQFGAGACDSCHSRHTFSLEEARQPQVCERCHNAPDGDQWGMYSSSRHGILFDLKQRKLLPADTPAPTCQTCHMPGGDHEVRAAWGFWAIRFPMPDDPQWTADRTTIMKAVNVMNSQGQPTFLQDTMKRTAVIRFTQQDWQSDRDRMLKVCLQCHSENYARQQLQLGDDMIRNADHVLAQGVSVVASLYRDGILPKPEGRDYPFPWLTSFDSPPTVIEQRLQDMFIEYRMSAFQGAFHNAPTYAFGKGLSRMQSELVEINEMAAALRRNPIKRPAATKPAPSPKPAAPKPAPEEEQD